MDPSEFAENFSAKKADADEVSKVLGRFGLNVDSVSLPTRSMQVSGTAAAIEAAFKPDMEMMRTVRQEVYRGRQGTIMIPSALKGIVTGIFGLDQRRVARRKSGLRRTSPQAGALSPLSPSDLEQRYNFPAGDAAGETIAIAEFGGGYFADDMVAYCKKFQLPVPNVQATPLSAPAYTFQEILALPPMQSKEELGNAVEVMLDVQVIAGLCPKANLIVYFASFDERGWVDLLSTAITQRPVALSISWGLAEEDPNWSAGAIAAINERLNAIRLLGVMHSRRARQGPATPSRFACAWSASCPFVGTDRFRSRCRTIESASDAATALSAVMAAVASGEVTPREAAEIASLVEIFVHTLEAHEFEHRLLALGEPMSTEEE